MALVSSIISKAREKIKAFYGLTSNNQREIKSVVEWLILEGHFIFGLVDADVVSLSHFS